MELYYVHSNTTKQLRINMTFFKMLFRRILINLGLKKEKRPSGGPGQGTRREDGREGVGDDRDRRIDG